MKTRLIIKITLPVLTTLILGAGCYGSKPATTTTGTGDAVSMVGMTYSPTTLTVAKGTTVTWTNDDTTGHTVTGDNGGPNSLTIPPGGTYPFTFDTAGTFPYHCSIHGQGMSGTVIVTE